MVDVKVLGLREVEAKMRSLGPKIALKALRGALVSGARVIKQDAIANAPVDKGRLRRSIYVKRAGKDSFLKENFIIGVRSGRGSWKKTGSGFDRSRDAFYWRFHEFGTKFMDARPFITTAFERRKMQALERIKETLRTKITQIVRGAA